MSFLRPKHGSERAVVVDDATPEGASAELARDGHFALLRNDRNLGFLRLSSAGWPLTPAPTWCWSIATRSFTETGSTALGRRRARPTSGRSPLSNTDLASYPHAA